ncbi:putative P-loop containing nucleoside triphosphate hydrolase [Helianthus annuus]|nr:putative P-loop containing nucleoside triphosphate hydrolase [Helianthus annuus]
MYIVDVFVSRVNITTIGLFKLGEIGDCIRSVPFNLDHVRRSLKSIKLDFMSMDSSQRTLNQSVSAPISSYTSSLRSKKSIDEVIVGLDRDAELIRDKCLGKPKKLDVVAVVRMGGIGKTTLATKVKKGLYMNRGNRVFFFV